MEWCWVVFKVKRKKKVSIDCLAWWERFWYFWFEMWFNCMLTWQSLLYVKETHSQRHHNNRNHWCCNFCSQSAVNVGTYEWTQGSNSGGMLQKCWENCGKFVCRKPSCRSLQEEEGLLQGFITIVVLLLALYSGYGMHVMIVCVTGCDAGNP